MDVFLLNKEKALGPKVFTIAVYQECLECGKEGPVESVFRVP